MMTAAMVFIAIGVLALLAYGVTHFIKRSPADLIRRSDHVLGELDQEMENPLQVVIVHGASRAIRFRLKEILTEMDEMTKAIMANGVATSEELQKIERLTGEVEANIKLIREIRSRSDECLESSVRLLAAVISLYQAMSERVRKEDQQDAADSLSRQASALMKLADSVAMAPVPVMLASVLALSRSDTIRGIEGAELMNQVNALIGTLKNPVSETAPIERLPALTLACTSAVNKLTKATRKADTIVRGRSVFRSLRPALVGVSKNVHSTFAKIEQLVSELY